ncbi:hypothetical protein LCM4579_28120 [Ensifer sp. LCM 4579]|nr:hypothetical protein LCM4579_28120 [Ensifer sp. LCM 4579]
MALAVIGRTAGCSRQPAAIFVVLVPLDNLWFDSSDLFFKHIDMIELAEPAMSATGVRQALLADL